MSKSRVKAIGAAVVLVAATVFAGAFFIRAEHIGGLSPTYEARDHDSLLSREAAKAQPLIAALARYRDQHGQFPPEASALGIPMHEWIYAAQPPGYTLSKKLGWDPTLHFRFEGDRGHWVFEPDDGSPEREIAL